jgi:hypothetical protein
MRCEYPSLCTVVFILFFPVEIVIHTGHHEKVRICRSTELTTSRGPSLSLDILFTAMTSQIASNKGHYSTCGILHSSGVGSVMHDMQCCDDHRTVGSAGS